MYNLRLYQELGLAQISKLFAKGYKRVLMVSPTGSGKTVVAAHAISRSLARGHKAMFVAHRKELVDQASSKLTDLEIPHGIIMAGYHEDWTAPVQIASVLTAIKRDTPEDIKLIIVDECHHQAASSYQKLISRYPDAFLIGLTATPFRSDGRGLGDSFDVSVTLSTVSELTDKGFLAPVRYWAPTDFDLSNMKKTVSGWDADNVTERARKINLVGDIVKHYKIYSPHERAVCFAPSVALSKDIVELFIAAGIPAAHLDDSVKKRDRVRILSDLLRGKILVVSNVGILTEGWDNPAVTTAILARPLRSRGLHLQMGGRILRPHKDKKFAKVIDHVGNVRRLGFLSDPIEADLTTGLKKSSSNSAPALRTCPKCFAVLPSNAKECPLCAYKFTGTPPKSVIMTDGTLREITAPVCICGAFETEKRPHPTHGTGIYCADCGRWLKWMGKNISPKDFYMRQFKLCIEKGWKTGRAKVLYKNRYGSWPNKDITDE